MIELDALTAKFIGLMKPQSLSLEVLQASLSFNLPPDYVEFMKTTNGGEGFVGAGSYVRFWPVQDLLTANRDYQMASRLPGCFAFGTDGAGEGFGFDHRTDTVRIVQFPFIGIGWKDCLPLGQTLLDFFVHLSRNTD